MSYEFEIKRLVLVDSAGFCYVELPVDHHGILLGDGNLGKSSLLNSLRLFLLPENSFKNSKNKFAFSTPKRDGFYDNEESYNHYFPSKYSFLILEVTNNVGGKSQTHCQILHRSSGHLSYERIFTPLPFNAIRHLFWDGKDEQDGIGFRVEELSQAAVFKALKNLDKRTLGVKDPAKLKTLMYQGELINADTMRYNIFPMNETDDGRVESLRTLILLLFDMNASSEPVAHAVANIIESDKKFVDDVLDFNIEHFLAKHNDLKQQDVDLTKVENLTDKFQQLKADFDHYRLLDDCEVQFAGFCQQVQQVLTDNKKQLAVYAHDYSEAKDAEKAQGKVYKGLSDDNKRIKTELATYKKLQNNATQQVEKAESLLLIYPDMPIEDVIVLIKEDISDNNKRLAALENESQKAVRINQLQSRIEANTKARDKHQANIENQHHTLEQQLPDASWKVLTGVNKKLALANPKRALSEQEYNAITTFTDLFELNEGFAALFDERFTLQTSSMVRDDEAMVQNLSAEIKGDNQELVQLTEGHGNALHKADEITRLKREVQQAGNELSAIEDLSYHKKTAESQIQPISQSESQLTANEIELKAHETALHELNAQTAKAQALRENIQKLVEEQVQLHKRCEHYVSLHPRLAFAMQKSIELPIFEFKEPVLNELAKNLQLVSDLGSKLLFNLREFVTDGVIDDEYGVMAESPERKAIIESFNQLQLTFKNLPSRRLLLSEQVRTHNESVQGYTNILQKNHDHIKRFERQLNGDFAQIEINDLTGIEVNIHVAQKFENLVNDTTKIDLFSNEQLPDHFYQRLEAFANDFFKSGETARLTMDKIITNLSYRTRKKHQNNWQTKQQSNSTTALINLKLVQILLGRLRRNDCTLMFPLVLDEVATVDVNQFDWLLDDIKRSGFNLFAASTHSASSELIFKIGRHFQLGDMRTARPYSAERSMVFWGDAEYFTDGDGLQMAMDEGQSDLFEAVDEQTI